MADTPVIALADVRLAFGGGPLFEGVTLSLSKGECAALVGRNGAGKSTLMRVIAGDMEADSGKVWRQPGLTFARVEQEPVLTGYARVIDYVAENLDAAYRAESELMDFEIDPEANPSKLSGGQLRRVALAKAFAHDPDVLMLDEPTNHLDVPMIEALEARLKAFRGLTIVVSHDRRFLDNVSTNTLWLRQGVVLKSPKGFVHFDDWADEVEAAEEKALHRLTTQLKDEHRWLARGVTGRRKRNQGRLTKLYGMREQQQDMRAALNDRKSSADLTADAGEATSRKLIDAKNLGKTYNAPTGPLTLVKNLSLKVLRGDRIGIIGANGAGKTTLVKLLLKEIAPDEGTVHHAGSLDYAYQDQTRVTLDPKASIWNTLAPDGGDSIMVQGRQRHVAAYAKDFLFRPEQLHTPTGALSGGERNRLALAIGLASPAGLLVMDEPTNDLDMQTLDLLEELLLSFEGTLILVSHDRAFLDSTVTSCLSPIGGGEWLMTPGGWTDAQRQLANVGRKVTQPEQAAREKSAATTPVKTKPIVKLSFKETHRLTELDKLMPKLTAEIAALESQLADPDFYARDPAAFQRASTRIGAARDTLANAELEWLEIEEKREALERGDAPSPTLP